MGSECGTEFKDWSKRIKRIMRKGAVKPLFYGIGNCSYSSGTPARIALAILGVQRANVALFYEIGNCSYSSGTPARIALAILGVQSAGFALF